jgi:hypothetical protein
MGILSKLDIYGIKLMFIQDCLNKVGHLPVCKSKKKRVGALQILFAYDVATTLD